MRQILFLSGKGGTGKTSLAGAFAVLLREQVLADCDVDAANLHLLLEARLVREGNYEGSKEAHIDAERCVGCGRCVEVCRFHAISPDLRVDPLFCEGCGACETACPVRAIALRPRISGRWTVAETPAGPLATAELLPGEEASGKLVTHVKRLASEIAEKRGAARIVIDRLPGHLVGFRGRPGNPRYGAKFVRTARPRTHPGRGQALPHRGVLGHQQA